MTTRLGMAIMQALQERSTRACINAPEPPEIPKGKETFQFEVGQTCYPTPIGVYKRGNPIVIAERWMQHGYCYYRDAKGVVHRTKDLQSQP